MFPFKKLKRLYLWFILLIIQLYYAYGSTSSSLPDGGDAVLPNCTTEKTCNAFCIKENKIYKKAAQSGGSGSCKIDKLVYPSSSKAVVMFSKNKNGYYDEYNGKGAVDDLVIYKCTGGSSCKQFIDSYYYDIANSKLYYCDVEGECSDWEDIEKGFYLSGPPNDPNEETKTYSELIKCTGNNTKKCEAAAPAPSPGYYICEAELLYCKSTKECILVEDSTNSNSSSNSGSNNNSGSSTGSGSGASFNIDNKIFINAGSSKNDKLKEALISCSDFDECEIMKATENSVYLNSGENNGVNQLIKCNTTECKYSKSLATEDNNEYYLNGDNSNDNGIIECELENKNGVKIVTCKSVINNDGVYINSNYSEKGDKKQLIQCSKDSGCTGRVSEASGKDAEYFVNAESDSLKNAIIFCSNKKCVKQTPEKVPTYYVGVDSDIPGLIECVEATSSTVKRTGRKRSDDITGQCKLKSAFTSQGYYLNNGFNKSVNQTIICDSNEGCETVKVDSGYYINAGDLDDKRIIVCEKEGIECTTEAPKDCPKEEDAVAGQYCYNENQLKFFATANSTAIAATASDNYYVFATVKGETFPGIKSEVSTIFKISRYFITRFSQSGIVIIDKNNKLVDVGGIDQDDIKIYDCNDNTKICVQRQGCTPDTYMYDTENKKVIFCNAGKMEYADITGYVVDSNRLVGSNRPYLIYCNRGEKCSSIKPKVDSYFVNSGFDFNSKSLIQCTSNNCITVASEVGYYVGEQGKGIIKCTSSSCMYNKSKVKVKYVNSGFDKSLNAIIDCSKEGCSGIRANVGYYLTYSNSLLIQCTSSSKCVEFTPTINYYDNADSSESSNSIINCVKNSQIVTCALEATNNGFYISSNPNVLIRCKSGSKCRTVIVKNGIFRGAIKITNSSKRESFDDDLEEDGRSISVPRGSDDVYGVIRCVAGKCSYLSPSEIAAIPVCEFNNNKCYITLEYSMTKSATTSISAGNICTNEDRSIFYFATDTVVVKPNVISGVMSTYIFTTTNSNCLEVSDNYSDMYFTVGSNIYLLDQGSVLQFYETGYYFINTEKNILVNGNVIEAYNSESVKLYRCNGSSCSIVDKPSTISYYVDVNKRILKYNVNSDAYSFAYDKDITCIFNNNKCIPNVDLKNQEFCVTYKGELVLATTDIKSRESGECYKANSINSNIYGYSQSLYSMNLYSAEMVDQTGYYIVSLSTNTTVISKNYKTKNSKLVLYGCQNTNCKVYEPEETTYYYDDQAKTILRYKDGIWNTPSTSGYAYISLSPSNSYIYRFTRDSDGKIRINSKANYGYYYTVDKEMYNCGRGENGECALISDTDYYFTNQGEIYYCVFDSEKLEPTECVKQSCVSGQYYYISEAYYRCEVSSVLVPVQSRYCSYNENVIINFPLIVEELPDKIKQAVEAIEKNNNSTAIPYIRGKNYIKSVSGIFTNCTYNVEETKSKFDLVCINNYVTVDEDSSDSKICSLEKLGYVECVEDENNPAKCNISGGVKILSKFTFCSILIITLSFIFQLFFNYN